MEVADAIETRLEVREYADRPISDADLRAVLEAARLAPSGKNHQHWHFVVVGDDAAIDRLAELSTSGSWIAGAAAAVVVLTDPTYPYHGIDAGRAITHAQFAAFDRGIGSCIYTGFDESGIREAFGVPDDLAVTAVVGLGYPADGGRGRKRREPLSSVAHGGRFGEPPGLDDGEDGGRG